MPCSNCLGVVPMTGAHQSGLDWIDSSTGWTQNRWSPLIDVRHLDNCRLFSVTGGLLYGARQSKLKVVGFLGLNCVFFQVPSILGSESRVLWITLRGGPWSDGEPVCDLPVTLVSRAKRIHEAHRISWIFRNKAQQPPFSKPTGRQAQKEIIVIKKPWRDVTGL